MEGIIFWRFLKEFTLFKSSHHEEDVWRIFWKAAAYFDSGPRATFATERPFSAQWVMPRLENSGLRWVGVGGEGKTVYKCRHWYTCYIPVAKNEGGLTAQIEGVQVVIELESALKNILLFSDEVNSINSQHLVHQSEPLHPRSYHLDFHSIW